MSKLISIIIPYYKETEREIFPLLSSLSIQVGVDFSKIECLLVNDGANNELRPEFLKLFAPLEFRSIMLETNGGCGACRQAGIDAATGEHVMFCDADDHLFSSVVLNMFMTEAAHAPDIVSTRWLEEFQDPKDGYALHENESTWMHGKLIRRQFLIDNDIRFPPDMRMNEDSYFLSIAYALMNSIRMVSLITYVWCYNENSISCKGIEGGGITSYESYAISVDRSLKELIKRAPEMVRYTVIHFIVVTYLSLHHPHWKQMPEDSFQKPSEKVFLETIPPYMKYYFSAKPEFIDEVYNHVRSGIKTEGMEGEESFNSWMESVISAVSGGAANE